MSVLVDASVIGSAYLSDERDHEACKCYLDDLLASRRRRVLAAHTLVETYVALTRRHRAPPQVAAALLQQLKPRFSTIISLSATDHLKLIEQLGGRAISGPRAYDGLLATAATKAGVREIATLNVRHFVELWPAARIVDPRAVGAGP
jgi:predicted nucleic acid-binding protein